MRAFILGNGLSLAKVDLTALPCEGSLVVACNRIHRHPSWEDGFRPDVWVFGDTWGNHDPARDVLEHVYGGYDCWIKSDILHKMCNQMMPLEQCFWWSDFENIHPYQNCMHRRDMRPQASWHPPHICNYTGAANAMVQIAVWKYDADEIFFLGIDGNYREGIDGNHMAAGYQDEWFGPPMVERINDELQRGHDIIAKELERAGIPAFNLTPTTAFNQYPKLPLEAALEEA
jgi:hypothetical protein